MGGANSGVRSSSFVVRRWLSGPLPFVALRREEGAGDGESGPGRVRSVRSVRFVRCVRECSAISPEFVVGSPDPFLSSHRDERKGQGMESPVRAVFGQFDLFGSFENTRRSRRSSLFVVRSWFVVGSVCSGMKCATRLSSHDLAVRVPRRVGCDVVLNGPAFSDTVAATGSGRFGCARHTSEQAKPQP
jgi:hypothetical protein